VEGLYQLEFIPNELWFVEYAPDAPNWA